MNLGNGVFNEKKAINLNIDSEKGNPSNIWLTLLAWLTIYLVYSSGEPLNERIRINPITNG